MREISFASSKDLEKEISFSSTRLIFVREGRSSSFKEKEIGLVRPVTIARYDLITVAKHDSWVRHCLLMKPGLSAADVKYAVSHSQALSQCNGYKYLRAWGIERRAT